MSGVAECCAFLYEVENRIMHFEVLHHRKSLSITNKIKIYTPNPLIEKNNTDKQVKSKKRVVDHGEVFTNQREVNAMLDLVKQETENIDSRFLEPACGEGIFLAEVLRRKLTVVESRYAKSQIEYERYAFRSISSLYGIDILEDNVEICRKNLFEIFRTKYETHFSKSINQNYLSSIKFVIYLNIIYGDALTLKTCGLIEKPIIFSEWSIAFNDMVQRRDYKMKNLLDTQAIAEPNLFSDLGEDAFIPEPVKSFPLQSLYKIADNVQREL